jgi:hypothetical protein
MATYIVNKYDGTEIDVFDGTINKVTNLVLLGKNYTGYGEYIAENFVRLLENFARNEEPGSLPQEGSPITGQLWYCKDDTSASAGLTVYDGTRFIPLPRYFKADTTPTPAIDGDLWWDRTNKQLFAYNGTDWTLIGPSGKASQGKSGIYTEDIYDTDGAMHTVVSLYVKDTRIYINSKDSQFTPAANAFTPPNNASVTGFASIKPGLNANTIIQLGNIRFVGTATGADNATTVGVSGLTESQLMRKDITQTMAGGLIINDNYVGLTIANSLQVKNVGLNLNLKNLSAATKLNIQNSMDVNAITIHPTNSYLGIFNSNPTTALDVIGNSIVSGTLIAAGTLIANATGVYSDGGKNWTESSLTNLNQLANGPGYLVIANLNNTNIVNGLGYTPAQQTGATVIKLGWNNNELEAYQSSTNRGALAFKSDVANSYLGRTKDVWQTSTDGKNRLLFVDNASTIFGSSDSNYIWKNAGNITIATLNVNGNLTLGGANAWTASGGVNPLTNLNQLTNGPGYITGINSGNVTSALEYTPVRQEGITVTKLGWNVNKLEAYNNTVKIGSVAFESDVANLYLGRTKDVWQTSTDGKNRVLFSDNADTIFGSHSSTYLWKDTANTTIATLNVNGNLTLGSGTAWTTATGPNPLTNLNQLTNGPGYITIGDIPSLGFTPVRQEGATVVKIGWNANDIEVYSGPTNKGALAFKSDSDNKLGRVKDVWQTSTDGKNRVLFSDNAATIFGSHTSTYLWKSTSNTTIATLASNGNLSLGSGIAWTTTTGPNPLTNLNQLTNGPGYITGINSGAVTTALGYTPVRQEGATVVKLGWNSNDIEVYSGPTNKGALAFKSSIPTKTSELDNDSGFLTSITGVPTNTNQLTNGNGFLGSHQLKSINQWTRLYNQCYSRW